MILRRGLKYLKYILLSRHGRGHGIHSPFVFDLVTRIFRNKTDPDIVFTIEKLRKRLISDHNLIEVNDMGSGAGSHKKSRKVSDIALHSPVSKKYGLLLSNLASEFGSPVIIELGTSFGISTMYMAFSSSDTRVYTIEGCSASCEIASRNFSEAGLKNITVINGSFDDRLAEVLSADKKPGMVYIDGNHQKEAVLRYFTAVAEISESNSVIVIDDIYYSRGMEEAWDLIKQFEKVSLTIDIFRMGIVFFREGMSRNNYTIRY